MQQQRVKTKSIEKSGFSAALNDFGLLVKFRLSMLVLFSALMSYLFAAGSQMEWSVFWLLGLGGFFITGSANALNQVLERDYDKLMPRTMNRPVAAGRMATSQAVLLAGLMALIGITLLTMIGPLAGFLGTLSLISYAFVYTPMKRSSIMAVVVGAIPGALPLIIGPVAFEGYISAAAIMLFTIQFFWQFPHFWAVAWLANDDYKKAGFYMLPTAGSERTPLVGKLSLIFCILLIGNALMAWWLGLVGTVATGALVALNSYFAFTAWRLYQDCSMAAARKQMFASFMHLPLTLIVLVIDRFI